MKKCHGRSLLAALFLASSVCFDVLRMTTCPESGTADSELELPVLISNKENAP